MNTKEHTITISNVEEIWGEKCSDYVKKRINEYGFRYREFSKEERDSWLVHIVRTLLEAEGVSRAGEHRRADWEGGWKENLELFTASRNLKCLCSREHA